MIGKLGALMAKRGERVGRDESEARASKRDESEAGVSEIMIEHCRLFEARNKERGVVGEGSFWPMRKHLVSYVSGFKGAAKMRVKLCQANSTEEVEEIMKSSWSEDGLGE